MTNSSSGAPGLLLLCPFSGKLTCCQSPDEEATCDTQRL